MTRMTVFLATAVPGAAPALAHAQSTWEGGHGHMMWGGGSGLFGALMMLVFWSAIIVGVVLGVRWLMERDRRSRRPDALEILRERLARGEIDPEEYEARRKVLES